ncbi:MAG: glycosyltransferase family 2 protein [Pseudomonadota bacterium]
MNAIAPVSVVVPCYRCVSTLERAVLSVLAQTQRPAEMILVDDASGDSTWNLIQTLRTRHGDWIKILALPVNAGAASARNAGWDLATQSYLAFLDADDAWHPRKIEIQYGYMQQHPDVTLSGHLCRQLPAGTLGSLAWSAELLGEQQVTWTALLLRHQFVTPSVMLKREIGLRFSEGARHMEDHRLWLEIVGASMRTVKLQAELAAIYKPVYGAAGLSADMWRMEKAELANYRYFKGLGKLSMLQSLLLQCYSMAKFVRRLVIVRFLYRT